MSKTFAGKELVKIFHSYLEKDAEDSQGGDGQGSNEEPKCPKCSHNEFEVIGYEDPKTGKWVKV